MSKKLVACVKGKTYQVPFEEILYMEKEKRKIHMHTIRGVLTFYGCFSEIIPQLDERFLCCHKSYVLNMDKIAEMSRKRIVMSDDSVIYFCSDCYYRARLAFLRYNEGNLIIRYSARRKIIERA